MIAQSLPESYPRDVEETISWLLRLERPPLPENPVEATRAGKPDKSPCFFDGEKLIPLKWKTYQEQMPSKEDIERWFRHPSNGIGTLGGFNGRHWLTWVDVDQKTFDSPEDCDRTIQEWLEKYPLAAQAPCFRTPGGGYRFLLAFESEPENFKANNGFCFDGGQHVGEFLCKNGSHTLLPPTKGVNGNCYQWLRWSEYPPILNKPEDVGIFPLPSAQKEANRKPQHTAKPNTQKTAKQQKPHPLIDFLIKEVYPKQTLEELFNWEGHNFQRDGEKVRGYCPWHKNQKSGTAFYAEMVDGVPLWRCPVCDGGSVLEYRHKRNGGKGSPKGRKFVEIVRGLAEEVGVPMPEDWHSSEKGSQSHHTKREKHPPADILAKEIAEEYRRELVYIDDSKQWMVYESDV